MTVGGDFRTWCTRFFLDFSPAFWGGWQKYRENGGEAQIYRASTTNNPGFLPPAPVTAPVTTRLGAAIL
ncbi:hypothetical protein HMPREF0578_1168 [Mobiluncus mulieris 28-1]|nr:hypothetical protein HMPREF0578_1168 [Mobiluncus mulieris 28-1]